MDFFSRLFKSKSVLHEGPLLDPEWAALFQSPIVKSEEIFGARGKRNAGIFTYGTRLALRLSCDADLWCRKRTSVTTMLDPALFEIYTTGDDRIDDEWIVQTNPPSAFKKEFRQGCDALLNLLQADPGLHAHKGMLLFSPAGTLTTRIGEAYFRAMEQVAQTAERELVRQP